MALKKTKVSVDQISEPQYKLEEELKQNKLDQKKHYVSNKQLYEHMCQYHDRKRQALEEGKPIPPLTDEIGKAILQIAKRRCNSWWRTKGYSESWKEEMIANAAMVATIRGHNFDPNKSTNPFAYFTQIINNGIFEQLKRERKQLYVRYKSMEEMGGYQAESDLDGNEGQLTTEDTEALSREARLEYIRGFEDFNFTPQHIEKVNHRPNKDINPLFDSNDDQ